MLFEGLLLGLALEDTPMTWEFISPTILQMISSPWSIISMLSSMVRCLMQRSTLRQVIPSRWGTVSNSCMSVSRRQRWFFTTLSAMLKTSSRFAIWSRRPLSTDAPCIWALSSASLPAELFMLLDGCWEGGGEDAASRSELPGALWLENRVSVRLGTAVRALLLSGEGCTLFLLEPLRRLPEALLRQETSLSTRPWCASIRQKSLTRLTTPWDSRMCQMQETPWPMSSRQVGPLSSTRPTSTGRPLHAMSICCVRGEAKQS
mmetsp:Transcript_24223/g.57705  ORF Transcript_24223/g.57705 Transcript_24223/m.57705 type:complete len:261 (-) Transcript_24223:2163-2945(-)